MREALGIIGAAQPGKALRPVEWSKVIVHQGLKWLLPPNERESEESQRRAIGVLFSRYLDTAFQGRTETTLYHLRLEGGNRRWIAGKNPHVRYVFTVLHEEPLPEDTGGLDVPLSQELQDDFVV